MIEFKINNCSDWIINFEILYTCGRNNNSSDWKENYDNENHSNIILVIAIILNNYNHINNL